EIAVKASISTTKTWLAANGFMRACLSWLYSKEQDRKISPEISPIQCSLVSDALTTSPAKRVVGSSMKSVGASTKAKKMIPPIQTISASSMRNLRNDMAQESIAGAGRLICGNYRSG